MLFWVLVSIVGLIVLYVVTSAVIIVSTRIEKTESGDLVIDSSSWHFKMTYPFRRSEQSFFYKVREDGISLCRYCAKFFWMVWIGWPLIILFQTIKTLVYGPFLLIFGFYPVPWNLDLFETDQAHGIKCEKFPLPKIKNVRILPAYLILPAVYTWFFVSLEFVRMASLKAVVGVVVVCVVICIVVGIDFLAEYTKSTDNESVSLLREWTRAKKKKICPMVIVR